MNGLKELLNISKKQKIFTKRIQKPKEFDAVKDNTLLKANMNFMADLLFLPETRQKYKYCLVVVDLANDEFDIEPLKDKLPENIVKAVEKMKTRKYIKLENNEGQSIRVDAGNEFKGSFKKYLFNHSILERTAQPNRHIQLANVERLNGILGTLFNGYMNSKEEESGKVFKEWTEAIPMIRDKLNEIRKKKLPDNIFTYVYPTWNAEVQDGKELLLVKPKYKVGDLVYVALESPENALGVKMKGLFRNGDYRLTKEPHKIMQVLYYHGPPYYRYIVNSFNGVSYQEAELRPAKGETEEKFKVKALIDKKIVKKIIYYKVWWKNYPKKEATWEPKDELIKDVPDLIEAYDEANP